MDNKIYRVTVKSTNSIQPSGGDTYWQRRIVYCGTDLTEARTEFLRNESLDCFAGYGNHARETVIEQFDVNKDNISCLDSDEVEI
jgi:hypothetical protein